MKSVNSNAVNVAFTTDHAVQSFIELLNKLWNIFFCLTVFVCSSVIVYMLSMTNFVSWGIAISDSITIMFICVMSVFMGFLILMLADDLRCPAGTM